MKLKARLKELTGRSNGMGYNKRKYELHQFIRGWMEYFKLADMQNHLKAIDKWLRRRLRMCIWKSWKNVSTRITNLLRCGIDSWHGKNGDLFVQKAPAATLDILSRALIDLYHSKTKVRVIGTRHGTK